MIVTYEATHAYIDRDLYLVQVNYYNGAVEFYSGDREDCWVGNVVAVWKIKWKC